MTTTNMNPEDRIEYWRMVMEDLDESGLSRTKYCEKNDINEAEYLCEINPDPDKTDELVVSKNKTSTILEVYIKLFNR